MDLIDRDELRRRLEKDGLVDGGYLYHTNVYAILDAMRSVVRPVGMTRGDVLAALDAAEARGDKAVVEFLNTYDGCWTRMSRKWAEDWLTPEVPRLNVRVRVTEQAPVKVPLTQLVGRTIHGETEPVTSPPVWTIIDGKAEWRWLSIPQSKWQPFPDGTLDLATGLVSVRPVGAS